MGVNYEEIRQRNIEEYGKGRRHLAYFSDLYATRTHFLYELLQNTEDALAKRENQAEAGYVEFRLYEDCLELRHNGKPFDARDVNGICGIGEGAKAGDYSQIGKFGIGFKSVYAYTLAPRIYSNGEHFEVRRFVEPHALHNDTTPTDIKPMETCIVLPFDTQPETQDYRPYVPQKQAVSEIGQALKHLGLRTLLFLRFADEIRWTLPDGSQGAFLRETRSVNDKPTAKYIDVTDGNTTETWLHFQRDTEVTDEIKTHKVAVEVGFLIQGEKVVRAQNTELVVSFPTAKKTELGFLVQGPFKTTKARDNIAQDSEANQQLIETAAQLAADSLEVLRELGLLNVESFKALPLQSSVFQEDSTRFFIPVYRAIREALKSKCLLPRHGGGFAAASETRLARGAQLADVFSPEQLGELFDVERLHWLDTEITADRMPELRDYLAGKRKQGSRNEWEQEPLVEGVEVDAKDMAAKLTASFLEAQVESWLFVFYKYLDKNFESYRMTPFVRLENGQHVLLLPNKVFLPPCDPSGIDRAVFPLVKQSLVEKQDALEFLRDKAKMREPDAVDVVIKSLLPKYKSGALRFDPLEYGRDLQRIVAACGGEGRQRLAPELKAVAFIACVPACKPESDEVAWKKSGQTDVFFRTSQQETWFAGNDQDGAWFIHSSALLNLNNRLCDLEIARQCPLGCDPTRQGNIRQSSWGQHRQGLDGFDPGAQILGLNFALQHWNLDRARHLWSQLLEIPHLIRGDIQEASNANRLDAAPRNSVFSKLGQACVDSAWLPDQEGIPRKPKDLLLTDLPDGFEATSRPAKEVAVGLGMKQPEQEQALAKLGQGDPRRIKLLEKIASASDDELNAFEKLVPKEIAPQPAPPFKDGLKGLSRQQRGEASPGSTNLSSVSNPNRYQKKLDDDVEDAVKAHQACPHTITFSPVRNQPSNSDARNFLYSEYQGRCQVTDHTFQKASANAEGVAENYFEACALLSYSNADYLNDAGNMLCVSADTMAKFKNASFEWMDDTEEIIQQFNNGGAVNRVTARILLAGEEARITWSERHFMRLIALWNKA